MLGGILAWQSAGYPVARTPSEDFVSIGINQTLTHLSTETSLNFTYTLTQRMKVRITMEPGTMELPFTNYDLYVKWDGTLAAEDDYDCACFCGEGATETCPDKYPMKKDLLPGTYFFQVKYFSGPGTFNITLTAWPFYTFDDIIEYLNDLNSTIELLKDQIGTLHERISSLNVTTQMSVANLKEDVMMELGFIRNLMYIFAGITIILITTTVYLAIRKPKIKT